MMCASRSANGSHLSAVSAATEKSVAPIRFKPRDTGSGWHFQPLEHRSGRGIDAPDIARLILPGAMPQLAVDPGDTRDEPIGFDGAQYSPGFRIDLMDLAATVLADPECPFSPGKARIPTIAGCRNRVEYLTGLGIDLPDHRLGNLVQMLSVKRRSCICRDSDRTYYFPAFGINGAQPIAGGEPDSLPV